MRLLSLLALVGTAVSTSAQSLTASPPTPPAAQLLATARALYDAPFIRGLVTFDCAVQFDWDQHFIAVLGEVPSAARPATARLKTIGHRILVKRNGATVTPTQSIADLGQTLHAEELEKVLTSMVANGLNAWLPFATNVILPVGQTPFTFEKLDAGYKLSLDGNGVQAQLLLASDFRLTAGVAQQPQPLRFETRFRPGPQGFLLASVRTGDTTDSALDQRATFTYDYQPLQDIELPTQITVTPARTETWRYQLVDCKVVKGVVLEVAPPSDVPVQP